MTLIAEFQSSPWNKNHPSYYNSLFAVRPAPEFATGEVVLASSIRALGFAGHGTEKVTRAGRDLESRADRRGRQGTDATETEAAIWRTVLHQVLQSPKLANQSKKRFLSLTPLVPDVALYSGAPRVGGIAWDPGDLIGRIIRLGSSGDADAEDLWKHFFASVSVGSGDDVWARWLQGQFANRRDGSIAWSMAPLPGADLLGVDLQALTFPARQFVLDLRSVIAVKDRMTRRQWTSLLEALLRLGVVTHVLWLCQVNDRIWRVVASMLGHGEENVPQNPADVAVKLLQSDARVLSYGNVAVPVIRDQVSRYLNARLGLNLVLWALDEMGKPRTPLRSSNEIYEFLKVIEASAHDLRAGGLLKKFYDLQDAESRTLACKKGIGANMTQFAQYTLGQRQPSNTALRGYDQGYFLHRRGIGRGARWILSPGPVASITMVHCCLHEVSGPRSVQRLANHLAAYGLEFDIESLGSSELGQQLRMLGLVLDSPDAESGMLLVSPFGQRSR